MLNHRAKSTISTVIFGSYPFRPIETKRRCHMTQHRNMETRPAVIQKYTLKVRKEKVDGVGNLLEKYFWLGWERNEIRYYKNFFIVTCSEEGGCTSASVRPCVYTSFQEAYIAPCHTTRTHNSRAIIIWCGFVFMVSQGGPADELIFKLLTFFSF